MDRVWAFLTALVLGLCAAGCAMADTDYPPFQGIVADVAGVLIWALVIYFLFFRKKRSRRR